jgi:hypothetical protein
MLDLNYSMQIMEYLRAESELGNKANISPIVGFKYAALCMPNSSETLPGTEILYKTVIEDRPIYKSAYPDTSHIVNFEIKYKKNIITDGNIAEARYLKLVTAIENKIPERVIEEKSGDYITKKGENGEVKLGKFNVLTIKGEAERVPTALEHWQQLVEHKVYRQMGSLFSKKYSLTIDLTQYNYCLADYEEHTSINLVTYLIESECIQRLSHNKVVTFFDKSHIYDTLNGKIIEIEEAK